MDRLRELEIRIEKLKNRLEDIQDQLDGMRLSIDSLRQVEPNNWSAWLMLVYLFGAALGIAVSWSLHHSVFWAVIHGLGSWLYVSYYLFFPVNVYPQSITIALSFTPFKLMNQATETLR